MTTLEIYNSIDTETLRIKEEDYKGWSDAQIIDVEFYMIIWRKIKSVCDRTDTNESRKGINYNSSYYFNITNKELLNSLRELYVSTKNKFVKDVIKTVGVNKRITEKQAEIVIQEMMKINIHINF
jgi:hypothetical protein